MKRKFIFILIIIIYLFFLIKPVKADFVVTEQYVWDTYESIVNNWLMSFHYNASENVKRDFVNRIKTDNYYVMFFRANTNNSWAYGGHDIPNIDNEYNRIYCYLIDKTSLSSTVDTGNNKAFGFQPMNVFKFTFSDAYTYVAQANSVGTFYNSHITSQTYLLGTKVLFDYRSQFFSDYIGSYGNATAENVIQAIESLENTIKDDTVSDSDISMGNVSSDSVTDVTSSAFDGAFTLLSNAFTNDNVPDIVINIPFTNKSFTFNGNFLKNHLQNSGASWVITTASMFWYFVVSLYIVKDIYKIINNIKNGNISATDTNIKADML